MKIALSSQALRVLGALLEKQIATPEYYPLSLNGVVAACNQKSNREPVMTLSEEEVQAQLDELVKATQLELSKQEIEELARASHL